MISSSTHGLSRTSTIGAIHNEHTGLLRSFCLAAARLDRLGFAVLRFEFVLVLCWIGGLKAANYEAEGIVPLVANTPLMSFFHHHLGLNTASRIRRVGRVSPIMSGMSQT